MKTINNNIKEPRVSFDNAKFLKEAGFSCGVTHTYSNVGLHHVYNPEIPEDMNNGRHEIIPNVYPNPPYYSAPTLQMAIIWVRVNFGIHIVSQITIDGTWYFELYNLNDKRNAEIYTEGFQANANIRNPEDALEAGLKHCLTNLILKK